ncbi:MAG: hypothetical protein AB7O45_11955 [Alphaproteobacteria bacterium]
MPIPAGAQLSAAAAVVCVAAAAASGERILLVAAFLLACDALRDVLRERERNRPKLPRPEFPVPPGFENGRWIRVDLDEPRPAPDLVHLASLDLSKDAVVRVRGG